MKKFLLVGVMLLGVALLVPGGTVAHEGTHDEHDQDCLRFHAEWECASGGTDGPGPAIPPGGGDDDEDECEPGERCFEPPPPPPPPPPYGPGCYHYPEGGTMCCITLGPFTICYVYNGNPF